MNPATGDEDVGGLSMDAGSADAAAFMRSSAAVFHDPSFSADFQLCFFRRGWKQLAVGVLPKSHTTRGVALKLRPPLLSRSAHVEMGQARDRQRVILELLGHTAARMEVANHNLISRSNTAHRTSTIPLSCPTHHAHRPRLAASQLTLIATVPPSARHEIETQQHLSSSAATMGDARLRRINKEINDCKNDKASGIQVSLIDGRSA